MYATNNLCYCIFFTKIIVDMDENTFELLFDTVFYDIILI